MLVVAVAALTLLLEVAGLVAVEREQQEIQRGKPFLAQQILVAVAAETVDFQQEILRAQAALASSSSNTPSPFNLS
jgi:hypothetical protein